MIEAKRGATTSVLFTVWALFMLLLTNQSIVFGSKLGDLVYGYVADANGPLIVKCLGVSLAAMGLYWLSDRWIERFRTPIVAGWVLLGFAFTWYARSLYPTPLGHIVKSKICTSFYSAAHRYRAYDLLTQFETISPKLPLHARTNMPGKTLLFDALIGLDRDAASVGLMIAALSAASGVFVYLVAQRWFGDRHIALLALVLFMCLPARNNFIPIPNVVTPAFILLPLWLLLVYLERARDWLLLALGLSLYVMLIYEPLPFCLGLVFVGAIAQRLARGELLQQDLWKLAVIPFAGGLAAHFLMKLGFGFDAASALRAMYADAVEFNLRKERDYSYWVVHNLAEFFIALGVTCSMVLALAWFQLASEHRSVRTLLGTPGANLALAVLATVLIIDLMGLNRGEVTRLWIFIAAATQVAVAGQCLERLGPAAARMLVVTTAMQSLVSTAMVGFLRC